MSWEIFERDAQHYEEWYASRRGRPAGQAESALLLRLLSWFPEASTAVEIGCGTGHFTRTMKSRGLAVVGLDRAEAILKEMRGYAPAIPPVLGDAHCLPFRSHAVDLAVFITTLEFSFRLDVPFLVPFAAGNFIYIGASDLIPEVKEHVDLRVNAVHFAAFAVGVAFMLLVKIGLEP